MPQRVCQRPMAPSSSQVASSAPRGGRESLHPRSYRPDASQPPPHRVARLALLLPEWLSDRHVNMKDADRWPLEQKTGSDGHPRSTGRAKPAFSPLRRLWCSWMIHVHDGMQKMHCARLPGAGRLGNRGYEILCGGVWHCMCRLRTVPLIKNASLRGESPWPMATRVPTGDDGATCAYSRRSLQRQGLNTRFHSEKNPSLTGGTVLRSISKQRAAGVLGQLPRGSVHSVDSAQPRSLCNLPGSLTAQQHRLQPCHPIHPSTLASPLLPPSSSSSVSSVPPPITNDSTRLSCLLGKRLLSLPASPRRDSQDRRLPLAPTPVPPVVPGFPRIDHCCRPSFATPRPRFPRRIVDLR